MAVFDTEFLGKRSARVAGHRSMIPGSAVAFDPVELLMAPRFKLGCNREGFFFGVPGAHTKVVAVVILTPDRPPAVEGFRGTRVRALFVPHGPSLAEEWGLFSL